MSEEITPPEGDTVPMSAENWRDFIPEDIRENATLAKYTDFGAMAHGLVSAASMVGKDKYVMPETDEQFGEMYDRLGRPVDPTGYEFAAPEGVTDEQKFTDEFTTTLGTTLHGLGLNANQAKGVSDFLYGTVTASGADSASADAALQAEADAELKTLFGPDVDAHVDASMRIVNELGGDGATDQISKEDLLGNPILVKILSGIAHKVLEDTSLPGGENGATSADIQSDITEAMGHPAYTDSKHIEHKGKVAEVFRLRQKLHAAAA